MKIPQEKREGIQTELKSIMLLALSGLGFLALYTETTGFIGQFLGRVLRALVGDTAILIPLLLAVLAVAIFYKREELEFNTRIVGLIMAILVLAGWIHAIKIPQQTYWVNGLAGQGGGIIGAILVIALDKAFGVTGKWLFLSAFLLVSMLLVTSISLRSIFLKFNEWLLAIYLKVKEAISEFIFLWEEEEEEEIIVEDHMEPEPEPQPKVVPFKKKEEPKQEQVTLPIEETRNTGQYRLPPADLLIKRRLPRTNRTKKDALNKSQILEETLKSFGVEAQVTEVHYGPAVTRFELQPAKGVKVSTIQALANDIALNLAAPDVRIEAPIPGKAAVGIEVPNSEVSPVYLRDVLESEEFTNSSSYLTVALGKDIGGIPVVTNLERLLHVLVAGATGSGKSVCVNSLITSLLFKATPRELRLMLIDPKMVELTLYNGLPHLLTPVITEPKKAAASLNWMVKEMEKRYREFASRGVRDITRYNQTLKEGEEWLPFIVVVIDELADLMVVAARDVEEAIQRLAQMGRAAGIHLVVATQRPSVDVITGVIKANIPTRIAFAVSSQTDSRVILDQAGADKLVGRGDMLFYPVGASKPVRVQGTFVTEEEIEQVLNYIKTQALPEYNQDVTEYAVSVDQDTDPADDELFVEALRVVVETGQASVSLLQRRLRVGYSRAGRLIDLLEEKGYIGPHQGSKPREVRISHSDFERLYGED